MLSVENLTVGYGKAPVLNDVDLNVARGEILAVCGPNGAGKSTLLRALSGQLKPHQRSRIEFNGTSIVGKNPAYIVNQGIALCPEGRQVFPRMTTEDNLRIGAYTRTDRSAVDADIDDYLAQWPVIERRRDSSAGLLSGGEQQILVIGRALMSNPTLLLLDEPSLGLAPVLVDRVYEGLKKITQERELSVLLVEQNVVKAMELADRIAVLSHGTKSFEADVASVTSDEVGSHYFEHVGGE